jgi:hypothetical protein
MRATLIHALSGDRGADARQTGGEAVDDLTFNACAVGQRRHGQSHTVKDLAQIFHATDGDDVFTAAPP